jgi:hypothetical protein
MTSHARRAVCTRLHSSRRLLRGELETSPHCSVNKFKLLLGSFSKDRSGFLCAAPLRIHSAEDGSGGSGSSSFKRQVVQCADCITGVHQHHSADPRWARNAIERSAHTQHTTSTLHRRVFLFCDVGWSQRVHGCVSHRSGMRMHMRLAETASYASYPPE